MENTENDEKANWVRSEPPTLLSRAEVTRLLDPWLAGREVLDAELMSGGLMNRNFHLHLSGRPSECVLRIYDRDPSACAREVAVLGMIGRNVPVPRVLYADEAGEHGSVLAVLSLIGGISLFTLRSMGDDDAVARAAYAAGRLLPAIGSFPGPPTPTMSSRALVELFGESPVYQARVSQRLHEQLLRVADAWQPRLAELSRRTGLVHCDFNSRNLFVARDGDEWRISGVLDWEFAIDASPFVDVGNFLRYERPERPRFEPHFSRGLRDGGMELPTDWRTVARMMDLPALCEFLARPALRADLATEVLGLIEATVRDVGA
jgi:aminoglycoside phosphotransferase (APT) family kinase protein